MPTVEVLDRVFDRDDVTGPRHVDRVDHRRHRRRLAGTSGTAEEDETLLESDEFPRRVRQADLVEGGDRALDQPQRDGRQPALEERIATEAMYVVREGEVLVTVLLEVVPLVIVEQVAEVLLH
jgi:hypothetical protein